MRRLLFVFALCFGRLAVATALAAADNVADEADESVLKVGNRESHESSEAPPAAIPSPTLTIARDLNSGAFAGRTTISIQRTRLVVGEKLELEIEFRAALPGYYFNGFFNGLDLQPAVFAMFDSKQQFVADLLKRNMISFRGSDTNSWTYVPTGGVIGTTVNRKAGIVRKTNTAGHPEFVPPGTYYLQLIYHQRFVSPRFVYNDKVDKESFATWCRNYDKPDLFRSNVLKIQLIDNADK